MDLYTETKVKNFKTTIYSKDNITILIKKLESINNKQLTKFEINNFVEYLKKFNYEKLYKTFFDLVKKEVNIENTNDHLIKSYMIEIGKLKFMHIK